ncbi:phosphatidylglycerophosphatase A [Bacteroidota bacterium]
MKLNNLERAIGSGFFTGYIPVASGTFGSLAAVLIYLIPGFENPTIMIFSISVFTILSISLGKKFESIYGKDPKQFTIDEFVGQWISLLFIPKIIWLITCVFIIWRFMDIVKPFPARQLEKIKGGWGIVLDDIISGFYTLVVVHILITLLL